MGIIRDISGQEFGRLTAIKIVGRKGTRALWECSCKCQEDVIVYKSTSQLTTGKAVSCGCKRRENNISRQYCGGEIISGTYWYKVKYNAKVRNHTFDITIAYCEELLIKQDFKCALSGIELIIGRSHSLTSTASIDRIDSNKHYIEGNIQWIHKDINQMKMNLDEQVFIEWCRKIANYQNKLTEENINGDFYEESNI